MSSAICFRYADILGRKKEVTTSHGKDLGFRVLAGWGVRGWVFRVQGLGAELGCGVQSLRVYGSEVVVALKL